MASVNPGRRTRFEAVLCSRHTCYEWAAKSGIQISPACEIEDGVSRMAQGSAPLPEYATPPVSEVALSVAFAPLENWRAAHAGLFWGLIRSEYPLSEAQPPIPSQIERFGDDFFQTPTMTVDFADLDTARFWFLSEEGTNLVQIQRDRFVVNWRKVTGDEIYPRYALAMRPRFIREWGRFENFIREQKIGTLTIQQCELTYVNDIPRGEGWETFPESLRLFSPWWGKVSEGFLGEPEMVSVTGSFLLPAGQGRLHFATQNLRRAKDQREVVQLRLTARGKPPADEISGILNWMDLGREWIVRGFTDLTSPEAHNIWGRIQK